MRRLDPPIIETNDDDEMRLQVGVLKHIEGIRSSGCNVSFAVRKATQQIHVDGGDGGWFKIIPILSTKAG